MGRRGNVTQPTQVQLGSEKVGQASAGGSHSVCVCASGRVFSFGENDEGCLGVADASALLPQRVCGLPSAKRAVALDKRSVVLTEAGEAFLLGTPRHEKLPVEGAAAVAEVGDKIAVLTQNAVLALDGLGLFDWLACSKKP